MNADLSRLLNRDVSRLHRIECGPSAGNVPDFAQELAPSRCGVRERHSGNEPPRRLGLASNRRPLAGIRGWLISVSCRASKFATRIRTRSSMRTEARYARRRAFARAGYRTIALMPGLRRPWPEGRFYGFDETLTAVEMEYPGPDFGWSRGSPIRCRSDWLGRSANSHAHRESRSSYSSVTLSTHFSFSPRPPYQPDWTRLSTDRKYDGADIVSAYGEQMDWVDFGPAYAEGRCLHRIRLSGLSEASGRTRFRDDPHWRSPSRQPP